MIPGTAPDRLLVELRLPVGFEAVDPRNPPEIEEEGLRIEIVDRAGVIRRWEWATGGGNALVDWHEAAGWRIAPDGLAESCLSCGRLTRQEINVGTARKPQYDPLCPNCGAGYDDA